MYGRKLYVCLLLVQFFVPCLQQGLGNPTGLYEYFMDQYTVCDGKRFDITGGQTTYIYGRGAVQVGQGPLSCSITLNIDSPREPKRWKLDLLGVDIRDYGVEFYIYDGESGGRVIAGYSVNNKVQDSEALKYTSGTMVTFRLVRQQQSQNYDIRIGATPIASYPDECEYGSGYNCDDYGYNYRILGTKEIIAIVGGAFGLVVIIVIVVVICCYRHQRGISRKWKEEKLGHVNTAASIHTLNGTVRSNTAHSVRTDNTARKGPWTTSNSRSGGFASIRRSPQLPRARMGRPSEDMDSVFDSTDTLAKKRSLPSVHNRGRDYRREEPRQMREPYRPPTYREAMRSESRSLRQSESEYDSEGSEFGKATSDKYIQGDDDHPQHIQIEREMSPRTKRRQQGHAASQARPKKKVLPPPDEDDTYDSIEPKKKHAVSVGTDDKDDYEDEEEEITTDEEDTEEEEDDEEAGSESDNEEADTKVMYSKVQKNRPKSKSRRDKEKVLTQPVVAQQGPPGGHVPPAPPPPNIQAGLQFQGYLPPGVHQPQPRYGYPPAPPHYQPPHYPQAQGSYPVSAGPGPLPPLGGAAVPGYPGPYPGPQYRPPQYSEQPPPAHHRRPTHHSQSRQPLPPSNPPVFSHLVNRGYKPLDGRYSPVSTSTVGSNLSNDNRLNQTDESDFTANIGSGVELMKRHTEI